MRTILRTPFPENRLQILPEVGKIDAGTQTMADKEKLSDGGILCDDIAADPLEDAVLWSRSKNLSACISALAIQDEAAGGSQARCLRKLEVRVASCWRQDADHDQASSLKGSEHSSLQLSSTQSPSSTPARENACSEGSAACRRRSHDTPFDSFSSVSSPLDTLNLSKES